MSFVGRGYEVTLEIIRLPGAAALQRPVRFFLHESYGEDSVRADTVTDDVATYVLHPVAGASTVGATLDGNPRTMLELDLRMARGAPLDF